ncbi:MAG: hypothetical protein ACI9FJ_003169 [Alteromonadaceae bacterium]|jgi:hypothetical protein
MTNHVLLDNISHKDLRIKPGFSAELGDNISYTVAFADEFRQLQSDYPIFLRKNSQTAQFEAIALLGFADNENLFVTEQGWDGAYIPLTIKRRPFLIGFQNVVEDGVSSQNPVVHIDMDSPRISQTQGHPIFSAHGGNSPYLEEINSILLEIYNGTEQSKTFADLLIEFNLLEAFTLKISLEDNSDIELVGFYTINEEKLAALGTVELAKLHQQGYLQHIYMMIASQNNIPVMIEKKNHSLRVKS